MCRTCERCVSRSFATQRLVMPARGYVQSVMLYQQVLPLPTSTGLYACCLRMPVKEYDLSARRIEGSHQKRKCGSRNGRSPGGSMYLKRTGQLRSLKSNV